MQSDTFPVKKQKSSCIPYFKTEFKKTIKEKRKKN